MKKKTRRSTKILLIRHAEKPAKDGPPVGVTLKGDRSKESLEVRGWQRAGALTHLLAPPDGRFQHPELAKPQVLYASRPVKRGGSLRPIETITPLAEKLGIEINSDYRRYDIVSMLDDVFSHRGVVLICWQREFIPRISSYILEDTRIAPPDWPEDRFDMVWVFDLDRSSGHYKFKQVPQRLLSGDRVSRITE
jgi:hypothetical protein